MRPKQSQSVPINHFIKAKNNTTCKTEFHHQTNSYQSLVVSGGIAKIERKINI
jgi:hypothetical protein